MLKVSTALLRMNDNAYLASYKNTRIYQVEEMTGVRTFQSTSNGVQVDVKAAGVTLTDGKNTKDGVTYYGNNVTIEGIQVLMRNSF